jgi:4-amino-4-deoxy-L-arabinose transferase-like glycosyltransferase
MYQSLRKRISGQRLLTRAGFQWYDLFLLAVVAGALFSFMLGNRALSVPDEARYTEIPREMVVTGDYLTPRLNGVKYFEKPVLFYWLEALSIKLFGLRECTLRLWPATFALFGCLAVAVAGARLYGRLSGMLAAAVLATSPLYYALGRAIILDMPVSVLLTIALLSFLIGTHEPPGVKRRLSMWSFYAFSALAVLTKGLIGILIPGMVIGAWIVLMNEWRTLKTMYLPTGTALFLLIAAPWHIMVGRANPEFFHFYFIQEHVLRYLTKMHGRYQPAWFFIPIVLLGLFPWSAFLVQAIRYNLPSTWRERYEHRDAVFLVLWAGIVFLFFSASSSKLVPYILPVFPPLSLLIGRHYADFWRRSDVPGIRMGYMVLLTAVSVLFVALFIASVFLPTTDRIREMLGIWRIVLPLTLAIGAAASWGLAHSRRHRFAFIALVVTSALFLIEVNAAAPRMETKSVKNLAVTLKALLKPEDEVAVFRNYYQDLPVYLERRVTVVDWKGELDLGTTVENTSKWMIDGRTFWKRWKGPTTLYMVTDIKTYEAMRNDRRLKLFPIARDQKNIIVSRGETGPRRPEPGLHSPLSDARPFQERNAADPRLPETPRL